MAKNANLIEKSRIYLVGFMGAGKSTIGPLLARQLNWSFCDLDVEIEKQQGCPIREIFTTGGEATFREMETAALRQWAGEPSLVIALGGGAFIGEANRQIVQQSGLSIFLDCPLELVLERCRRDSARPLFNDPQSILQLVQSRRPFYLQSDLQIDVRGLSPEEIVLEILAMLNRKDSRQRNGS
jgi:shikimate kinase